MTNPDVKQQLVLVFASTATISTLISSLRDEKRWLLKFEIYLGGHYAGTSVKIEGSIFTPWSISLNTMTRTVTLHLPLKSPSEKNVNHWSDLNTQVDVHWPTIILDQQSSQRHQRLLSCFSLTSTAVVWFFFCLFAKKAAPLTSLYITLSSC